MSSSPYAALSDNESTESTIVQPPMMSHSPCYSHRDYQGSAARRARRHFLAHSLAHTKVFGICPMATEMKSMACWALASDWFFIFDRTAILFLSTLDRAVEALNRWDRFSVNRQGHVTIGGAPYPISVAPKKTATPVRGLIAA